ncbi:hypothetical protein [Streptomyces sp. CoH27]|nr:hypothetical protein [Streptomyces sp. CoH27]
MLILAAERARGATVLGMPIEYTRTARTVLGNDALLAITQPEPTTSASAS